MNGEIVSKWKQEVGLDLKVVGRFPTSIPMVGVVVKESVGDGLCSVGWCDSNGECIGAKEGVYPGLLGKWLSRQVRWGKKHFHDSDVSSTRNNQPLAVADLLAHAHLCLP